ncbi:regulatory protein RecX [Motilibacter deserti]|uniref:Regulatory protein RecX n=1 Tax=Motilibacter deserti TaxID=2714956 RepID=A0ABX0GRY5_9ACTN|nr:regulatory protein RecX [Motilibacter deserti]NHC13617.1 regulatory protein RecX [Motilibacter deserti]
MSQRRRRGGGRHQQEPAHDSPAAAGPAADPLAVARKIVLDQLAAAPRTRAQLEAALAKRDVPEEAGRAVLDRFTELGYIDDAAFARSWVASRSAGRGLGRRALAQELRTRGVAAETVAATLDDLDPTASEQAVRRLVARKLAGTRGLDPAVRLRRVAGMLARKGHAPGAALQFAREGLAAEGAEPADDDAPSAVED